MPTRRASTGGTRRPYNGPRQTANFINGARGSRGGRGGSGSTGG